MDVVLSEPMEAKDKIKGFLLVFIMMFLLSSLYGEDTTTNINISDINETLETVANLTAFYNVVAIEHILISKKTASYTLTSREAVNRYTKALLYQLYIIKEINYNLNTMYPLSIGIVEPKLKSF